MRCSTQMSRLQKFVKVPSRTIALDVNDDITYFNHELKWSHNMRAHMEQSPGASARAPLGQDQDPDMRPGHRVISRARSRSTQGRGRCLDQRDRAGIACGRPLLQAKARVGHGHWLAWVEEHLTSAPARPRTICVSPSCSPRSWQMRIRFAFDD